MGYIDYCSLCKYSYTSDCKYASKECNQEKARILLEISNKKADVQPVNQWISVDDKLPEWDKTVLVWYASDTLFGVSEGYGLSWYHGSWRLNELNGENIRIFYWQYLPEKPKEG